MEDGSARLLAVVAEYDDRFGAFIRVIQLAVPCRVGLHDRLRFLVRHQGKVAVVKPALDDDLLTAVIGGDQVDPAIYARHICLSGEDGILSGTTRVASRSFEGISKMIDGSIRSLPRQNGHCAGPAGQMCRVGVCLAGEVPARSRINDPSICYCSVASAHHCALYIHGVPDRFPKHDFKSSTLGVRRNRTSALRTLVQ
jgi:hypothetical protein